MSDGAPAGTVRALYRELLEEGVRYFFPGARLEALGRSDSSDLHARCLVVDRGALRLEWMGTKYLFHSEHERILPYEEALLKSIARVLSARYLLLFGSTLKAASLNIFRGLPEDRYVSAFLEPEAYADPAAAGSRDRIAQAIEVLRLSALTTYENRRISTGVLLFGSEPDPCHAEPSAGADALPYASPLTATRSFHRLCDGARTVALVDRKGVLAELVDVREWSEPFASQELPVPSAERYQAHARATLCGGHIFLILTNLGEIKVIARGAQAFSFRDGRWHLTDAERKYGLWMDVMSDKAIAETLFQAALNLAEERRGGLFIVLDDARAASSLVAEGDLLIDRSHPRQDADDLPRREFRYLLSNRSVTDLAPKVLESIARIDGAIVIGPEGSLEAFGAILRPERIPFGGSVLEEGGRTAAALSASLYGKALKVSEDGIISFSRQGRRVSGALIGQGTILPFGVTWNATPSSPDGCVTTRVSSTPSAKIVRNEIGSSVALT
jgi:hypothetical protein